MGLSATAEAAKTAIDRLTFFGDAVLYWRGHHRNGVLVVSFLVSIPVAFLVYAWAFAIWTLIPVFIVMVTRIRRRRAARAGSGT